MSAPKHAPHPFSVQGNELCLGGMTLSSLAEQIGRTPFYAYDRQNIVDRIGLLRAHLPSALKLHYAIKANPMPAVVALMAGLVDGFDVASAGELKLALETGVNTRRIGFAGPGKTDAELRAAIAAACILHVESELEMERAVRIGLELDVRPQVAIRVNPAFEIKTSGMKMGGGAKPFGIDAEQIPGVLSRMRDLPLDFLGFHVFAGSQMLNAETINSALDQTAALVRSLAAGVEGPIRHVNLGGGFGIPYFPGEVPLDLKRVGDHLAVLLDDLGRDFPQAEFVLELGRYLVGEAGVYVSRVIDRKASRGRLFLVTDGGMHQHLAASGNFGQVLRKNYPVLVGNRVDADAAGAATVVGALCTPLDVLADQMPLGHAQVGDLIAVLQSGAYGLSASPVNFLSHEPALEVLV